MEKIVGSITSKTTGKSYQVKWNSSLYESWILKAPYTWMLVCKDVRNENAALNCTQRYIDSQPDMF